MSYYSKWLSIIALAVFFTSHKLCADWNSDFDQETDALIKELPALQHTDYARERSEFKTIRTKLLKSKSLVNKIQKMDLMEKALIKKKSLSVIVKKRNNHHIHDLYPWELSFLLGSNAYITPSFPMEIGGFRVIVQKLEPFEFGERISGRDMGGGYSKNTIEKVSLETYWKAHLQAYIVGLSDLVVSNIGVNSKGIIRFFDNEACLIYYNAPFPRVNTFSTGFICQSFDWDQYRKPLDSKTAFVIQDFIRGLGNFEESLKIYCRIRNIALSFDAVRHRLNILQNFPVREGTTFQDFFAAVFPKMSPGLDGLCNIVSRLLHKPVGHGTALFYATRHAKKKLPPPEMQAALTTWVNTYVNEQLH